MFFPSIWKVSFLGLMRAGFVELIVFVIVQSIDAIDATINPICEIPEPGVEKLCEAWQLFVN